MKNALILAMLLLNAVGIYAQDCSKITKIMHDDIHIMQMKTPYNAFYGFEKLVKQTTAGNGAPVYTLNMGTSGYAPDQKKGVVIILVDGTRIERPEQVLELVKDEFEEGSYDYYATVNLTLKDVESIKNSPIASYRLGIYADKISSKKPDVAAFNKEQQAFFICLLNL